MTTAPGNLSLLKSFQVSDTVDANLGIILIGVCKMVGNIFSALIIDKVSLVPRCLYHIRCNIKVLINTLVTGRNQWPIL